VIVVEDRFVRPSVGDGEVPEPARGHDVFVSYSRADRDAVVRLTQALAERGKRAWVDLEDIPPSAEWMAEIRAAIEAADGYLVAISSDLARSKVCAEELEHASAAGKRIVPIQIRPTDPESVPRQLSILNWIDATDGVTEAAAERIVQALDTDLAHVRAHTRLLMRANEWLRAEGDRSLLLRGRELKDAEVTLAGPDREPRPTETQTRFVLESRKVLGRRQRGAIAIVTVMLVVAASLGVAALLQRRQAIAARDRAEHQTRVARSQALAAQALSLERDQPDLAALLSLQAEKTAHTAQANQAVHVSAQTGAWVQGIYRGHTDAVFSLAFSPDGTILASGSLDGTVALWNVQTGQQVGRPLTGHRVVQSIDFSRDGRLLASGGDNIVILSDPNTGERIGAPLEFTRTTGVAFSPNDDTLAISSGNTIWLWDAGSGHAIGPPLHGHTAGIWSMVFAPDGRTLASSSADGAVLLWNASSMRPLGEPLQTSGAVVESLAFSPDGRMLAGIDRQGVRFWDPRTGEELGRPIKVHGTDTRLAFSPDGRVLATSSDVGGVRLWDARTHRPIAGRLAGQQGSSISLAFSPDGGLLASGSTTGNVALWGTTGPHRSSPFPVYDAVFSPDGQTLATGNADGTIALWDPQTDEILRGPLDYPSSYVNQLAYSPAGNVLAAGYGDGTAILWDAVSGDRIGEPITGQQGEVTVAFSPDGSVLATGSFNGEVLLFDPVSAEKIGGPLSGFKVQRVAFSPDGSMLAASGKVGKVSLWDPATGEPAGAGTLRYAAPGDIQGLAFSPDGHILATGFVDGSITLWDPRTGERIADLHGHTSRITRLRYSPDGTVLASGSINNDIVFWDTRTMEVIGAALPGYGSPWGIDFSPDGRLVASTGENGSTYVRDLSVWTEDGSVLTRRLCLVAGRNLTRVEWSRFVPSAPYVPICPN
jgi:WD40 repeat protein